MTRWWDETTVYQKNHPGRMTLECDVHSYHYSHPYPRTAVQQACGCGKYRTQYVNGIIEDESCDITEQK